MQLVLQTLMEETSSMSQKHKETADSLLAEIADPFGRIPQALRDKRRHVIAEALLDLTIVATSRRKLAQAQTSTRRRSTTPTGAV